MDIEDTDEVKDTGDEILNLPLTEYKRKRGRPSQYNNEQKKAKMIEAQAKYREKRNNRIKMALRLLDNLESSGMVVVMP